MKEKQTIKEKKPTEKEYEKWLKDRHSIVISEKTKNQYESVVNRIYDKFKNGDLWKVLNQKLQDINDEYASHNSYPLLMKIEEPDLLKKEFDDFLLKTYRKNVLYNDNWPNPPKGNWILPHNWFTRINDMVRTSYIVKYMDGVEFISNKIQDLSKKFGFQSEIEYQAKEEGYYAAHLTLRKTFEIPRIDWDTEEVKISIEIQISTQLQDVIKQLLHKHYEQRRKLLKKVNEKWQWDHKSDEFATNYLGHILHYIEGMILGIRDKQKGGKS